jgi:cytidyltransferase-like protein
MEKIVCVSMYADPCHVGHLELLQKAKKLGDKLYVIVNNDEQATMKKGKPFMPAKERVKIIRSLECVDAAIIACDKDRTVCETIRLIHPNIFANGGDQTNESIPEVEICRELGIQLVDGLGAKIQSSSWLIEGSKSISKK